MKTFIYPTYDAKRDKSGNLYIDYFRKSFEKSSDFEVVNRFSRSETLGLLLNSDARLFILHWVDLIPSKPLARLQALFFRAGVALARLRGARIVWVLHNKSAHNDKSQKPEKLMNWMASKSDIVLTHSNEGCLFFRKRFPDVTIPCVYIPHPVYSDEIIDSGRDIKWDYIIWGGITRRKRVLEFVRFASESDLFRDKRILICGRCADAQLDEEIKKCLPDCICYENRFLSDDELRERILCSERILFTYDGGSVLSSGALIYSLNFCKPVIGPRVGSFADLEGIVSCYDEFSQIPGLECDFDKNLALSYISENQWETFPDKVKNAIFAAD